jgi:putative ABC transport system permease protein
LLGAALGRGLGGLIVGLDAFDPLAFGAAPAALLLAALVACWIPARRATRIAPMSALRAE